MKKLLALFCLIGALSLAADNYRSAFNDCLYEGNLQSADSILQVWSNAMPEDPDLFPARFNLLFNAHTMKFWCFPLRQRRRLTS